METPKGLEGVTRRREEVCPTGPGCQGRVKTGNSASGAGLVGIPTSRTTKPGGGVQRRQTACGRREPSDETGRGEGACGGARRRAGCWVSGGFRRASLGAGFPAFRRVRGGFSGRPASGPSGAPTTPLERDETRPRIRASSARASNSHPGLAPHPRVPNASSGLGAVRPTLGAVPASSIGRTPERWTRIPQRAARSVDVARAVWSRALRGSRRASR